MRIQVTNSPAPGAKDIFAIGDIGEFARLAGSIPGDVKKESESCWRMNYKPIHEMMVSGDLSGVPESDKLLTKFEDISPLSQKWRNISDVVGGVPNVPAFLAGHPMTMRRRQRMMVDKAPLCAFIDLTVSASINNKTMQTRGAVALAFVRMLASQRPVELWACCGVGGLGYSSNILIRIDTAPLDLARAAHLMTHPGATRLLCYGTNRFLCRDKLGKEWGGSWAYDDVNLYRKNALDNFKAQVNPSAECIMLPAAYAGDPMVAKPEEWLRGMLEKYGNIIAE